MNCLGSKNMPRKGKRKRNWLPSGALHRNPRKKCRNPEKYFQNPCPIKKLNEKGLTGTLVLGGHKKWDSLGFPVVKSD